MSVKSYDMKSSDPRLGTAQEHFQRGEWEDGFQKLDRLVKDHPLDLELRSLRHEMRLRARVDEYERVELKRAKYKRLRNLSVRLVLGLLLIAAAAWGVQVYWESFLNQVDHARAEFEVQKQAIELGVMFRDATDLFQSGRYTEALSLFQKVEEIDAGFPYDENNPDILEENIQLSQKMLVLQAKYNNAIRLIGEEKANEALAVLEEISTEQYGLWNVELMIRDIKRGLLIDSQFEQGELYFADGSWDEAIAAFEDIYYQRPDYKKDVLEERLFFSYINAGKAAIADNTATLEDLQTAEEYFRKAAAMRPMDPLVMNEIATARNSLEERLFWSYVEAGRAALVGQNDSLEALQLADAYFEQALKLRPENPEIAVERELARRYLDAQAQFVKGRWGDVIELLEMVYAEDPTYASGTARQTLYDAYMARGEAAQTSGVYESALYDYQRAAVLADATPDSAFKVYEVKLKLAGIEGILGQYEEGVRLFRDAVDIGNIRQQFEKENQAAYAKLEEAERFAAGGDYGNAFRVFRDALNVTLSSYDLIIHKVEKGEYLTLIAARYGSSVNAIVQANNIINPNKIYVGQELTIPVIKH